MVFLFNNENMFICRYFWIGLIVVFRLLVFFILEKWFLLILGDVWYEMFVLVIGMFIFSYINFVNISMKC